MFREIHRRFCDLPRCSLKCIERLCRGEESALGDWEPAHSHGSLKPSILRTWPIFTNIVGRPSLVVETRNFRLCGKIINPQHMQIGGAQLLSWVCSVWPGNEGLVRASISIHANIVYTRCYREGSRSSSTCQEDPESRQKQRLFQRFNLVFLSSGGRKEAGSGNV